MILFVEKQLGKFEMQNKICWLHIQPKKSNQGAGYDTDKIFGM